jgi:glutamine amidotransferase
MIAIIDYGAGNVASVANAVTRLGSPFVITSSMNELENADKIIFPGVGEASFAVNQLLSRNLFSYLQKIDKPLLGICLGMQLLCSHSEEGNTTGLGIFPIPVLRFDSAKTKVPHIGWNTVHFKTGNKLFKGLNQDEFFYFANSYYAPTSEFTTSLAENNISFSSSLEKDNYYGVQFHPEKSSAPGLKVLKNFIEYC